MMTYPLSFVSAQDEAEKWSFWALKWVGFSQVNQPKALVVGSKNKKV